MPNTKNPEPGKPFYKQRFWRGLVAGLILAVIGWGLIPTSGSKYQGKSATYWFSRFDSEVSEQSAAAITAFRAMGSNAVPMLVAELEATPSPMNATISSLLNRVRRYPQDYDQQFNWRRDRAAQLLFEMGEHARPALPSLEKAATDPMWYIRISAKAALIKLRNESLAPYVEQLKDKSDPIKWYPNAMLLGKFGTNAQAAVPLLLESLQSSDQIIQAHALIALGMIKSEPKLCVPAIIPFLTDVNVSLRQKSYYAILSFAEDAGGATEAIIIGLHDSDPWTKRQAIIAVAKILSPADRHRVLPQLEVLLDDPDPFISNTIKKWLPKIKADAAKR